MASREISRYIDAVFSIDCLELLQSLPDGCVDLVISSPPYNLGKEYEDRKALDHYLSEQSVVLKELHRTLKDTVQYSGK